MPTLASGLPFSFASAWLPHLQQSSKSDTRDLVSVTLAPSDKLFASAADRVSETAPPSGNAIADLFRALRRRRNRVHPSLHVHVNQGEFELRPYTHLDDASIAPSKDEAIISDAKAALRACLVL